MQGKTTNASSDNAKTPKAQSNSNDVTAETIVEATIDNTQLAVDISDIADITDISSIQSPSLRAVALKQLKHTSEGNQTQSTDDASSYSWSPTAKAVIQTIEQGNSVLVTGKAGTGKSTLLKHIRSMSIKNMVIVAPTGIAALNVQGATIHSVFKLPHKCLTPGDIHFGEKQRKLLKAIDVLIIDEISMVRADVLDAIHISLSLAHGNDAPFGGVQVVFFGDLFQLPPVVERGLGQYFTEVYGGCYFFNAKVMQYVDIQVFNLNEVYRQTDQVFIRLLNAIREKRLNSEGIAWLNNRCVRPSSAEERAVVLCTTNVSAQRINQNMLDSINEPAFRYHADVNGEFSASSYPTEQELVLKVGARVMLLKNDSDKRYVNGSIGEVIKLTDKQVVVQVNDDKCIIQPEKWEAMSYNYRSKEQKLEEEIVGEFRQLPLKLAWAITIHKSQGLTFDAVRVDLGSGAFACGQVYVAFSRCRSITGLSLARKLNPSDIQVDTLVVAYEQTIQSLQRTQAGSLSNS